MNAFQTEAAAETSRRCSQMRRPKYSVLLPTRNGVRYLPYAVRSVLSQPFRDFELIVSNNHSSDGTADYLRSLDDPRLTVLVPERELSMTRHFEFVLSHAKGDWVTAIGDDDALMPFFFEYLEGIGLKQFEASAITFRRAAYFWPGCEELYKDRVVSYRPSRQMRYVNNTVALFRAMCLRSSYMDLPQAYTTGLIRNDFIQAIKARSGGVFFHSIAPDAGSAAILAVNAQRHLRIEQPVFWTGTSPKSVGYSQGSSGNKARSIEYDSQNSQQGVSVSSKISSEMRRKLDLSVLLYDAILLTPNAGRFWASGFARWCFFAGQVLRGGEAKAGVLRTHRGPWFWLKMGLSLPAIWTLRVLDRRVFERYVAFRAKILRDPSLVSSDRERFSTIEDASDAVLALYRQARRAR